MELNLVKVTYDELGPAARCILDLKKAPFFFLWFRGDVLMNKGMGDLQKVAEAIRNMWKRESIISDADSDEMDLAYGIIRDHAGETAAEQAFAAWRKAAEIARNKRGEAAASKWYQEVYQKLDYDKQALIEDCGGYDNHFLMGLTNAYHAARDANKAAYDFRGESASRAIFACGFLKGQEASAPLTGNAVKDDIIKNIHKLNDEYAGLVARFMHNLLANA